MTVTKVWENQIRLVPRVFKVGGSCTYGMKDYYSKCWHLSVWCYLCGWCCVSASAVEGRPDKTQPIKCYQCNSFYDKGCSDFFDNKTYPLIPCPSYATMCRKIIQESKCHCGFQWIAGKMGICFLPLRSIAVCNQPHHYGNSRATWDHAVLPATQQRWHSHLYPSQWKLILLFSDPGEM